MGCEDLTRYVLILLNVIFFLIGSAALGVGIWALIDNTYIIKLTNYAPDVSDSVNIPSLLENTAYILIACGAFIFIISFAGCCGAWKKVKFLLVIYAILVGLVLLLEIAAVVTGYFFLDKVETELKGFLRQTLTQYDSTLVPAGALTSFTYVVGTDNSYSLAWDFVQVQFECCGVDNGTDYDLAVNWRRGINYTDALGMSQTANLSYAVTCCAFSNTNNVIDALNQNKASTLQLANSSCPLGMVGEGYRNVDLGCVDSIKSAISRYSIPLIGIGGAILAIELLLIIMAGCVVCCIKNSEELA